MHIHHEGKCFHLWNYIFLFVLGSCVAWIFVVNSSLRIKRRKNPTLLSAYAASPEVWDINTVCFLYGFPKGTENVMIFNWLFHVFSALVQQPIRSWNEKEHLWLNHGEGEQLGRKEQLPQAVQASERWSERRHLWDYIPLLNKAIFKKSELGGTTLCCLFVHSYSPKMQPRPRYVGVLLRKKPSLLFSKKGIVIIVTNLLSACFC